MNRILIIIGMMVAVLAILTGLFYFSFKPWFWIFWIVVIGTIIGAVLLRNRVQWVGNALAYYCAQMTTNNNWWSGTCFAIAIIFTISAWLAGAGEPIVLKSAREVSQPVKEWVHTEQGQRQLDGWLYGTDYTGQKGYQPKVASLKEKPNQYSSWFHFWTMIFWWIVALISYPVTRRDEVAEAIRVGIRRARKKHDGAFGTDGKESGGEGESHGGVGDHLISFAKLAIPFEILIEIAEMLFTKLFSKIKPLVKKTIDEIKGV